MGALAALGARSAGGLQYGEAYDDPTSKMISKYLASSGGDHALAAKAAWNDRERARKRTNLADGSTLLQIENQSRFGGGDPQALQVAMKLKNLAASGGKTQGGYAEAPRPELTGQARGQYAQLGQQAIANRSGAVAQQQRQAESDATRLAEQRRIIAETEARDQQLIAARQAAQQQAPQGRDQAQDLAARGLGPMTAVGALQRRR